MNPKVAWPLSIVLAIGVGAALDRVLLTRDAPGVSKAAPALRGRYVLRRDDALAAAYAEAHEVVFGGLGIDTDRVLPLEFEFRSDGQFRWTTPLDYDPATDRLTDVAARFGLRTEGTGRWARLDDAHVVLRFDATKREAAPERSDPSRRTVVVSTTSSGFELIREIGQGGTPTRHSYDLQR
ncbi:MAG: hypothetical protein U1E39_12510 [Planctomycetota bacterium]